MKLGLSFLQTIITGTALLTLTGCATRSAKKVTAHQVPSTNQQPFRVQVAPLQDTVNTKRPVIGTVMDPEAVTYTQVPERIIYIPGKHTIFSRTSAEQQVAYNLIPVSQTPEHQPVTPPYFEGKTIGGEAPRSSFTTSFINSDTSTTTGTARRLGVTSQNPSEKERAKQLLRETEELKWNEAVGWIGFTEIETTQPKVSIQTPPPAAEPPKTTEPPKETKKQEIPHGTPPPSQNKDTPTNPTQRSPKPEKLIELGQ